MEKRRIFLKALYSTIPVMTGYLVLGVAFGLLLRTKGFGVLWALGMSGGIYAGSMQFVAIDLMAGNAGLLTVALTTLAVNARHLLYGISLVDEYKDAGAYKPYLIFALTDETYSLVCHGCELEGKDRHRYYFYVSLLDHIYWIAGGVLGSLAGSFLNFNTEGMDFTLSALFITVVTEQWMSESDHSSAIVGALSSVICLLIFGAESFLIPSMLCIALALAAMHRRKGMEA